MRAAAMARVVILALSSPAAAVTAWSSINARSFLSAEMQPEVVAKTLSRVQDEWRLQAQVFTQCELTESPENAIKDCDDTPSEFVKSCSIVVDAVVKGSSGNPEVMKEYMGDVCSQTTMAAWHQTSCVALAKAIKLKMPDNSYSNRNSFPTGAVCDDFWLQFLAEQKALHAKEVDDIKQKTTAGAEKARERLEHQAKSIHEEEKRDDAKAEAEIANERKIVARRAERAVDRSVEEKQAEVDAIERESAEKIAEATAA
jgi:hypothetical protein